MGISAHKSLLEQNKKLPKAKFIEFDDLETFGHTNTGAKKAL
jgi:hypothetical protein